MGCSSSLPPEGSRGADRHCVPTHPHAGHVWLWRYTPALQQAGWELVGAAQLPLSWVNCLAWAKLPAGAEAGSGEALVLVAGTSEGSVSLWGASVKHLASLGPLPLARQQQQQHQGEGDEAAVGAAAGVQSAWLPQYSALERWGTVTGPDLRAVTSLAVCLAQEGGDEGTPSAGASAAQQAWRLLVAAGKTAGGLCVWESGPLAPPPPPKGSKRQSSGGGATAAAHYAAALRASCTGARVSTFPELHGLQTITGLAWAAAPTGAAAACAEQLGLPAAPPLPLLCSTARTGELKCLQLFSAPGSCLPALRELSPPQPCGRRGKKEAGHGTFGLAASPSGLFVASVAQRFPSSAELRK